MDLVVKQGVVMGVVAGIVAGIVAPAAFVGTMVAYEKVRQWQQSPIQYASISEPFDVDRSGWRTVKTMQEALREEQRRCLDGGDWDCNNRIGVVMSLDESLQRICNQARNKKSSRACTELETARWTFIKTTNQSALFATSREVKQKKK